MEIAYAALAEEVRRTPEGSIDLLNVMDSIHTNALPVHMDRLMLFFTVLFEPQEAGTEYAIRFRVTDDDARALAEVDPFLFQAPTSEERLEDSVIFTQPVNIVFRDPGNHWLEIWFDDELLKALRFKVKVSP